MPVHYIQEFIKALSNIKEQLNERDLNFLYAFQERFSKDTTTENVKGKEALFNEEIFRMFESEEELFSEEIIRVFENRVASTGGMPEDLLELLISCYRAKYENSRDNLLIPPIQDMQEGKKLPEEIVAESKILSDKTMEKVLSEEDLKWVQERFAERWTAIADKFDDYTFYSGGVNLPWVSLAKELATILKIPYLLILIPVLANSIDPNNFSRLNQLPDARSLYLSNDNTWHRILALYEELQKSPRLFSIHDKLKEVKKPRPLTLNELYRIRSKRGEELAFETGNGTSYSSFWNYVIRESAPTWKETGGVPTQLLPTLLELIEIYFEAKREGNDLGKFQKHLKVLASYLAACYLADVNNLYGTQIQVNEKSYFLVEILLDCMENKEDLSEKLLGVAEWLGIFDPSMISKCENLAPIYKKLHLGSYFDLSSLQDLVIALNVSDSSVVKPRQEDLLLYLNRVIGTESETHSETREQVITKIKAIYALRWSKIIDTTSDHLRMQNKDNLAWMHLAQSLAGAGYINANYYKLLIPTLRQDFDLVTKEPITAFPLSHYVLSTRGTELILLDNCLRHHKANGTFYNCNYSEPMPLSYKERRRLEFADPRFYHYFLRIEETVEDPPISKETVNALKNLVNGTLNPEGLSSATISDTESIIADKSYEEFLSYLSDLAADEKDRLFRQTILLRSYRVTFAEVMDLIQANSKDDRECIAVHGKYIAKLVMDYAPWIEFRKEIEQKVDIRNMRLCSARKIYREYIIDDKEVTRRVMILLVSLLTHNFSYLWLTGIPIRVWDQSNIITDTGKEIFLALETVVEEGNYKQIRYIYYMLMEKIVKPAIANKTWTRYGDTDRWLKSIDDGSMFNGEENVCFEPELLLITLSKMAKTKSRINLLLENFLDALIQTLLQPKNSAKKWVRINVIFTNFLNENCISEVRSEILRNLRTEQSTITITPDLVNQSCTNYLIHRLALIGSNNSRKRGLFGPAPGQFRANYEYHITGFKERMAAPQEEPTTDNKKPALNELVERLQTIVSEGRVKRRPSNMQEYLYKLSQKISSGTPTQDMEAMVETPRLSLS